MLNDGYCVLAGTLTKHERDTPNNQGRWFHVKLTVDAGSQSYQCAVDVDSKQSNTGVMWKTVILRPHEWTATTNLSPGQHLLRPGNVAGPGTASTSVLDYIRDQRFQPEQRLPIRRDAFAARRVHQQPPQTGGAALAKRQQRGRSNRTRKPIVGRTARLDLRRTIFHPDLAFTTSIKTKATH